MEHQPTILQSCAKLQARCYDREDGKPLPAYCAVNQWGRQLWDHLTDGKAVHNTSSHPWTNVQEPKQTLYNIQQPGTISLEGLTVQCCGIEGWWLHYNLVGASIYSQEHPSLQQDHQGPSPHSHSWTSCPSQNPQAYFWPISLAWHKPWYLYVEDSTACQWTLPKNLQTVILHHHHVPPQPWPMRTPSDPLAYHKRKISSWYLLTSSPKTCTWPQSPRHWPQKELQPCILIKCFAYMVFQLHYIPTKIIHEWGPWFQCQCIVDIYKLLGIGNSPCTACNPQTDGQNKHINQEFEQYLELCINRHQDNWVEWLSSLSLLATTRSMHPLGSCPSSSIMDTIPLMVAPPVFWYLTDWRQTSSHAWIDHIMTYCLLWRGLPTLQRPIMTNINEK